MSQSVGTSWWRRHWLVLLAALLTVAGLARLRFEAGVLDLLPDELPAVRGLKLHQSHFNSARDLIVTLRAPDADQAVAAAKSLAGFLRAQTNLVSGAVWQPPIQESAVDAGTFLAWLWLNQPPELFAEMASRLAPARLADTLESTRAELATSLSPASLGRLGYDPFGFSVLPGADDPLASLAEGGNWFASPDGAFRVLFVRPRGELANYRETAAWLEKIRASVADWRAETASEVTIGYTGSPAFVAEVATGMERDLSGSLTGTLLVIGVLFWWAHRRWLPLLWLSVLLLSVVVLTLAMGGLIFGTLNVVSLGFAAVLLGLGVDYALVLYQEACASPERTPAQVSRLLGWDIFWSALTTGGAFLLLNFAGLPGLSQLGSLVAVGVLLGAVIMLKAFLPVALSGSRDRVPAPAEPPQPGVSARPGSFEWLTTVALLVSCAFILAGGLPRVDRTTSALQPSHSQADAALRTMQTELGQGSDLAALIVTGTNETDVAAKLVSLRAAWPATHSPVVRLPDSLWPRPDRQQQNLARAIELAAGADALRTAATNAGFVPGALELSDAVLAAWREFGKGSVPVWPTNAASRWLLDRFAARTPDGWLALGLVELPAGAPLPAAFAAAVQREGGLLASWSLLGEVLLERVQGRVVWIALAMLAIVTGCLWMAFRRVAEVVLSLATLVVALIILLAVMKLAGWTWNLINLTALPLFLGAGEDYSLHVQMALRRHGGDVRAMRRVTGRALRLCAATTIVGFGSLYWSGNAGLASLGLICATAVAIAYLISVYLLPVWWRAWVGPSSASSAEVVSASDAPVAGPSSLYRAGFWRAGQWLARMLPAGLCVWLGRVIASAYALFAPRRLGVVTDNLLPVLNGDRALAVRTARTLFARFGEKLVDLWRQESGAATAPDFRRLEGLEHLATARATGRGVLLVTPHLGNWEAGGPLALAQGLDLLVITQAEPGEGLTELREAARRNLGIKTLVIGRNPFAFVEVIKHLQAGGAVALLMDRPPAASSVTVELFGRPFQASIAAAELARASGCSVVGVHITREAASHVAHVMPPFEYDRQALGSREGRTAFTQEILRAFEPAIRQHADQWYHFVPIWPAGEGAPR